MPMFPMHVFTPLTRAERQAFVEHYREYLRRRDGVPDTTTYTFSVRESVVRTFEENPVVRAVDWPRFLAEVAKCPHQPRLVIEREAGESRVEDIRTATAVLARLSSDG